MRTPRGQSLVLFALTVLLLALMVLMTLALGSKVRSRMELQTVADAAAYSNSVATARTLNSISVMNRVIVAHTVSTIGTISLISWATLYWADTVTARNLFLEVSAMFAAGAAFYCLPPPPRPPCGPCTRGAARTAAAAALLWTHAGNVKDKLNTDTALFNGETLPRFNASLQLAATQAAMFDTLQTQLNGGTFATQYATAANLQRTTSLGDAAAPIHAQELSGVAKPQPFALGAQGTHPNDIARIVMGTRGHPFVPDRSSPSGDWSWDLSFPYSVPAGATWVDGANRGRGYLNTTGWSDTPNGQSDGIWAHDDMPRDHIRALLAGLPGFGGFFWWLRCTFYGPAAAALGAAGDDSGEARVGPWDHPGIHRVQHSFQTFPAFLDYEPLSLTHQDDLYGQPKNLAIMSKDLSTPTDPWDVSFNFHLSQSSGGQRFDTVTQPAAMTGGKQLAIGTGITYYSRADHYAEPPNLFAPYWRASLSRLTIDRPSAGNAALGAYDNDLQTMLNATGQTEASVTYQQLVSDGYKGFQ